MTRKQKAINSKKRSGGARPDLVSGQVMLLAMLALAGTVVGATTVAGLLITYQIRQSVDFTRSAQAIFTADAGIDWALYQFFKPGSTAINSPTLPANITLDLRCYDVFTSPTTPIGCDDPAVNLMHSAGIAYGARRIFELDLGASAPPPPPPGPPPPPPPPGPPPPPPPPPPSGTNVALLAAATTNSESATWQQTANKAIDGVIDGWPGDYTKEWVTEDPIHVGAWIRLAWGSPVTVDRIVLYDRQSSVEQITDGTLLFSDGTSISTGALNDTGPTTITFTAKTITSVTFTITSMSPTSQDVGLMEFEAYTP